MFSSTERRRSDLADKCQKRSPNSCKSLYCDFDKISDNYFFYIKMPGATEIIKPKRPRFRVTFPILKLWCVFFFMEFHLH